MLARWLAEEGHEVTVLSGGILTPHALLSDELKSFGVMGAGRYQSGSRTLVTFRDGGAKVNLVCTRASNEKIEATDIRTFVSHGQRLVRDLRPQLTVYMGGERGIMEVARLARNSSSRVLGTAWEFGWENRSAFEHAHRVLCGSKFLSQHYQRSIGLQSVAFPPPVEAPSEVPSSEEAKVLVLDTRPEHGMAAVAALRDQGFAGSLVIEGHESDWDLTESQSPLGTEFRRPSRNRHAVWQGTRVALSISVEGSGRAGAEALVHGVSIVADKNGPVEETSAGFGRFMDLAPEEGDAWAEAVLDSLRQPIDRDQARQEAMRLYAPAVQRDAYLRLMHAVGQVPAR